MLTRCPACQTVFRVSPEQLAARAGRVRCGHCLNAFNATHNAVTGTPPREAPAEPEQHTPPAEAPASKVEWDFEEAPGEAPADAETSDILPAQESPPTFQPPGLEDEWAIAESAEARETVPEMEAAGADEAPAAFDSAQEESVAEAGSGFVPSADPSHSDEAEDEAEAPAPAVALATAPPAREEAVAGRHTWGIALGGLAVALAVQSLFLLRQPLTQSIPALREPMAELCQRLGCDLPLPREAGEISIEASDLHPEPGGQGNFVLHATIRNRAPYPQAYPHVELSLTDATDKALVRRVFSPAEWAPGEPPEAVFAPGATVVLALPFNAAGVAAVGYRVYAFYP